MTPDRSDRNHDDTPASTRGAGNARRSTPRSRASETSGSSGSSRGSRGSSAGARATPDSARTSASRARSTPAAQPSTESRPATPAEPTTLRQRLYRVPLLGAVVYLLWPPKTTQRTVLRRAFSWSTGIIALLGIGMVAYPWAGEYYPPPYRVPVEKLIEWSNFLSDMETNRIQDRLASEFEGISAADFEGAVDGKPLTRLQIPKLKVDTIVVEGTSQSALRAGAGHYPHTPLPGRRGNVAIAGHRTTYGRPFNSVDRLEPGDRIILGTPVGRYTYVVTRKPWITNPNDWAVVEPLRGFYLTLTTCHPKGSARQRLIVQAKLVKTQPVQRAA